MAGEACPAAPDVVLLRSCQGVVVRQGTPARVGSPQEGEACLQRQQQQDGALNIIMLSRDRRCYKSWNQNHFTQEAFARS